MLIWQIHNMYKTPSTYKTLFIHQITEILNNRENKKWKASLEQNSKWCNREKLQKCYSQIFNFLIHRQPVTYSETNKKPDIISGYQFWFNCSVTSWFWQVTYSLWSSVFTCLIGLIVTKILRTGHNLNIGIGIE